MAYGSDADFKAIGASAKKSPAFREMAGDPEPDADGDEGAEGADLRAAYQAATSQNEDEFVANMLSAIKSCIASYGAKK